MKIAFLLTPAVIAALVSLALTPLAMRMAQLFGAIDHPDARKVHLTPVPRLGGVAIIGATGIVLALLHVTPFAGLVLLPPEIMLAGLLGLLPILSVSVMDDIAPVGWKWKFLAHFTGAALAVALGIRLNPNIHAFGYDIAIGWFAVPLSILWIAGVTNAFNIVDGLDGLSAGLALISALSLAAVALIVGRTGLAATAFVLAGAIAGFLPVNLHPAKMFMGDSGAASIGFLLACLALRGGSTISSGLAILLPIVVLGLPLAETLVSMARRMMRRLEKGSGGMFEADRGHFHHRLLELGLDQRRAVLLLYGVGLALAACGLASLFLTATYAAVLLATLLAAGFIGVGRLGYDEFALIRRGLVLKVYDAPVVRNTFFVAFADLALIVVSLYAAIVLKYEDWALIVHRDLARDLVVVLPATSIVVFWSFRQYRGAWRLASIHDFVRSSVAIAVASTAGFILAAIVSKQAVPLTLFVIFSMLAQMIINGARLSYRVMQLWTRESSLEGKRVLIYGAGAGGAMALREMLSNQELGMKPVAFIDDDPQKIGKIIHGVPVRGTLSEARRILASGEAEGVVVSSDKVAREKIIALRDLCTAIGASLRYFRIDFHTVSDYEFNVYENSEGPLLKPGRKDRKSAELRLVRTAREAAAKKVSEG